MVTANQEVKAMGGVEANIKLAITEALREKYLIKKNILRLVLGEVQTINARNGPPKTEQLSDQLYTRVIKKIVESNEETLSKLPQGDTKCLLLGSEITILESFLPKPIDPEVIKLAIQSYAETIKNAKNDGAATGAAMKILKEKNLVCSGEIVSQIVKEIRNVKSS